MKLENFIGIINEIDPELVIYQIGNPSFDSEIYFFNEEESGEKTEFWKDNIKYVYLLEVFIAQEFIEGWLSNLDYKPSDLQIAERLFEYIINDA